MNLKRVPSVQILPDYFATRREKGLKWVQSFRIPTVLETIERNHFKATRYGERGIPWTDPEGEWLAFPGTFSGYSCSGDGAEIAISNRRVLEKRFARLFERGAMKEDSCPIAATEILVRATLRDRELNETVESLARYPVLDESDLSTVEMEGQEAAWDSYIREDLAREIGRLEHPEAESLAEKVREWSLSDFWREKDAKGISQEIESDGTSGSGEVSWYLDTRKVAARLLGVSS